MATLPTLDTRYPALIFKADRVPFSHGALGIARTLGTLGVPVYAIVEDAYTPLAFSRYVTKAFVWKNWPGDRDLFVKAILTIGKTIGQPTVLIPMDDLSAIFVAESEASLSQLFIFPHPPPNLPRLLANKASFYALCGRIGIHCARSIVPSSADDIDEFIKHAGFPIVMKVAEQWRLKGYQYYNPKIIHNREMLFEIFRRVKYDELPPIVLQEYIAGEDWIYHGYCNSKIDLYLGFTGKKLLDYPVGAGSTALGLSYHNEELHSLNEAFLRAISYSGICDVDWRLDERDGQYKVLDCNPRVGLNFQMFENTAGIDVVRAQHLDTTGRRVNCVPMIQGRLFTVETLYLRSFLAGESRSRAMSEVSMKSIIIRRLAWWNWRDPLPFFVMSVRLALGILRN